MEESIENELLVCHSCGAVKDVVPLRTSCGMYFCFGCITKLNKVIQRDYTCPCLNRNCTEVGSVGNRNLIAPIVNPFGKLYIQANISGLASYWIDPIIEKSYILYDPRVCNWHLDNGQPPPINKKFKNVSYDMKNRIFRGAIEWVEVSFYGDKLWLYEFVFSKDFTKIERGTVTTDGLIPRVLQYQRDLIYSLEKKSSLLSRVVSVRMMLALSTVTLPRVKRMALKCPLTLLSVDLLHYLQSFLF